MKSVFLFLCSFAFMVATAYLSVLLLGGGRPEQAASPSSVAVQAEKAAFAVQPLKAGDILQPSDIVWRPIRDGERKDAFLLASAFPSGIGGYGVVRAVRSGQPVLIKDVIAPDSPVFLSEIIPPDSRAVPISLPVQASYHALLIPGKWFDLFAGPPAGPETHRTDAGPQVLESLRLLKVGDRQAGRVNLIVEVPDREVQALAMLARKKEVILVARPDGAPSRPQFGNRQPETVPTETFPKADQDAGGNTVFESPVSAGYRTVVFHRADKRTVLKLPALEATGGNGG
ncbi:SAF domain-containing protein [Sneathiella chinensis]|uniref:SAF domain-containing protein n=1 Tax=Sneathiella chinensis TaxID=349750 RepID=A0ABQ5U603_9PROT|nr:SAF domain-containing protein [Sneathiella chinensis]GLQ06663.1 hypothetical protein GCM10007924_18840 [Sneathiella chinensis]